ncbi:orotidine-5'-phosphate decarboxylase [Methanobrevibacter arboriphilus JCM 13429 = DSM 1125]|uniref:Orotidine 5'-phosphate decarboxylase n=1 Tax=Methanobrevibacter arboriphilus JCM 13429 = DSM 1125 TaxID=1300164 RepID=A0A1V6N0A4_METAZ|nr:orotidine-5'-phosphate decarboxylase [Methanobrevibacter arboriphilus]OQD58055.1 orotidine-5'-phosphate decarboxylase [Methanobrevibacter arboriphilus JCM 13429 = DSM 1125]
MNIKNNIILAMDLMDILEAYEVVEEISDYINTIKIGYPLTLAEGLESIGIFKDNFDFNIICDYKVADIPETNSKIADLTFNAGADAIITHGFVGEDSVKACLDVASDYDGDVFLLTEMSHSGAQMFLQGVADDIAKMGLEMGIKNYVAPSTRLNRLSEIRNIVGKDSFIISPGVGTQGGDPKDTLEYADALIIGRSIYASNNPKEATESILNSLK